MNFKKIKEIISFDVRKSVQNKGFVILNILMFIAILLVTNWSNISNYLDEHNMNFLAEEQITIQVLDNENLIFDRLNSKYADSSLYKIEKVETNPYSKENIPADNLILVEVNSNEEEIISAKIVSKEGISNEVYDVIYTELSEARADLFANKNGISREELDVLNEEISVERELLGVDAENSDTKEVVKAICTVVVYMVLILILSRIANEIARGKGFKIYRICFN